MFMIPKGKEKKVNVIENPLSEKTAENSLFLGKMHESMHVGSQIEMARKHLHTTYCGQTFKSRR
jgi:hypothetical protein